MIVLTFSQFAIVITGSAIAGAGAYHWLRKKFKGKKQSTVTA